MARLSSMGQSMPEPDREMANILSSLAGWTACLRRRPGHEFTPAPTSADPAQGVSALALVSHEMRLPLAGMIGFADLLQTSNLTTEQQAQAQIIADSGRMLLGLIDHLQAAAPTGGTDSSCDPRAILQFCIRLLYPLARDKGLNLGLWVDPAVPGQLAHDAQGLRQILINLVGNAIRFTARGGIDVEARVETTAGGRHLAIAVIDSGIGIATDQLERIFRPFAQADASIATQYGGTGLGLAISQSIAARMGGRLTVHSRPGVGSNFTLCLPLEAATRQQPVMAPALPDPLAARTLRGMRVLVAEDDGISRRLLLALAASLGLEIELAGDGEQAMAAIAHAQRSGKPFGAVMLDINLPGQSGLEVARFLRAQGHTAAKLPILALSADCHSQTIAACQEAGMQAHLAKPVSALALARELARCLHAEPPPEFGSDDIGEALFSFGTGPGLQERYLDRKGQLLAALRGALDCHPDAVDWDRVASDLHRFAGVAGHFGDASLGETSRRLELRLRHAVDSASRQREVRQAWPLIAQVA